MSELLLHRIARGDAKAVRECIHRYGPLVWSLARRFTPNKSEAEDGVQDVFLDLWRSAKRYDPSIGSEVSFVSMMRRRRLIDRRRKALRQPQTQMLNDPPIANRGSEHIEASGEAALAARALQALRPEQREVLVMSACHGMSHSEIANRMNMPLGTVKAHARRGLIKVRELLHNPQEGMA